MRSKSILVVLSAVVSLGVMPTGMAAGDPSERNVGDTKAEPTATNERLENAATARALARYGNAVEDPVVLIAAARMMKQNPVREGEKLEPEDQSERDAKDDALKMTPSAVLARAEELAGDRQDLVALVRDVEAMGSKGAITGAGSLVTTVNAGAMDEFNPVVFEGDEPAQVAIHGDGDTDLDLYVFDENNQLICEAESYDDREFCEWTPAWTGEFYIKVYNRGDVWNRYQILHN